MGENRKVKDILSHIALALTGIGLVVMLGNKLLMGSMFFNSTKRQKRVDKIDQALKRITSRSYSKT